MILKKGKNFSRFLAVDIGNTNVDAAILRAPARDFENFTAEWRVKFPLSDAGKFSALLPEKFGGEVDAAAIGAVAEGFSEKISEAVKSVFGLTPLIAGSAMEAGLEVVYENPQTLGIDRLANAAAVFSQSKTSSIAVDFGTATTFDCVLSGGVYIGGAITAGIEAVRETLIRRAPALPETGLEFPPSPIGANTADCVKSGIMFGCAQMVDGMIKALSLEMSKPPRVNETPVREMNEAPFVVATGGLAPLISGRCETVSQTDDLLTLKGLAIILQKNTDKIQGL